MFKNVSFAKRKWYLAKRPKPRDSASMIDLGQIVK